MRTRWLLLPASLLTLFQVSCSNTNSDSYANTGTGPFDANGNYVESLADSPSKWKGAARSGSDASPDQAEIASIQGPLMGGHSASTQGVRSSAVTPVQTVPIVRQSSTTTTTTIASTQPKPRPQVASRSSDDDSPRSSSRKPAMASNKDTKPKGKSTAVVSNTKTTGKNSKTAVAAKTTPSTKGKGATAAVKVKPKPTSSRYAVKQGDSLYAIAKRYGTTASAIQKANGMSGTVIRPGQSLVVPKQ